MQSVYMISQCAKNSNILGSGVDLLCHAVNKRLCVVKKRFGRFSVLIGFGWTLILILIVRKELIQMTFITLNSTPKGLFTAADLT